MKYKVTIVIVISVIVLALGIGESIFLEKTFSRFDRELTAIMEQETYNIDDINNVASWWKKKSNIMECTVPHTQLIEINVTLGELQGAVESGDMQSASALLQRLYNYSSEIRHIYRFNINNII